MMYAPQQAARCSTPSPLRLAPFSELRLSKIAHIPTRLSWHLMNIHSGSIAPTAEFEMAAQHPEADVGYVRKSRLGRGCENAEKLGAIIGEIVAETLTAFWPRPSRDPLAMERVHTGRYWRHFLHFVNEH
jgi:hypothetical protein